MVAEKKDIEKYQIKGSPSYEMKYQRNCDKARRTRNIRDYAERLADKTYTKDEVKNILLEVAYWR